MATSFIHSTNSYRKSALCQVPRWTLGCELNTADTPLSPGAPILVEEMDMEKRVQGFSSGTGLKEPAGNGEVLEQVQTYGFRWWWGWERSFWHHYGILTLHYLIWDLKWPATVRHLIFFVKDRPTRLWSREIPVV